MTNFYVISLEGTPERTAHAKAQFERENVPVTWVWGFDAVRMGIKPAMPMHPNPDGTYYFITPGACALVLSHYMAFRFAENDDCDDFVIFEDDVVLPEGFLGKLDEVKRDCPEDTLGVWLEYCCVDPNRSERANGKLSYALPMCTAAVWYKREAIPHVIEAMHPAHAPVDILIKDRAGGILRPCITVPQMCFQETYKGEMPSTIHHLMPDESPKGFIY